jgi:hypothetical protein
MVRIYYHIYAIEGVESIIDEQLKLIETHFDMPFILNVGISIADDNSPTDSIIKRFYDYQKPNYRIRDVRSKGHEFVTLDLIEKDKETFGNSDYIFYLHTKGASKQKDAQYPNIVSWRNLMQYFNIEKIKDVFRIFDKTDFNTYGVLLETVNTLSNLIYSGNFWWMKGEYAKTINIEGVKKNRFNAELAYVQKGIDWKPYSEFNKDENDSMMQKRNMYEINFKREDYTSLI